jgi:hypothetical protein
MQRRIWWAQALQSEVEEEKIGGAYLTQAKKNKHPV